MTNDILPENLIIRTFAPPMHLKALKCNLYVVKLSDRHEKRL